MELRYDCPPRGLPNILITGTPGVGKTVLAQQVCESCSSMRLIDIGQEAKDNQLYQEYDEDYECHVLDDEKMLDQIEDRIEEGGNIIDYHAAELFPKSWLDAIFVLRTNNTKLYDRLTARGYTGKKLQENLECEIFQVILDEAKEKFSDSIICELLSNTPDEMEENVQKIVDFIENFFVTRGNRNTAS